MKMSLIKLVDCNEWKTDCYFIVHHFSNYPARHEALYHFLMRMTSVELSAVVFRICMSSKAENRSYLSRLSRHTLKLRFKGHPHKRTLRFMDKIYVRSRLPQFIMTALLPLTYLLRIHQKSPQLTTGSSGKVDHENSGGLGGLKPPYRPQILSKIRLERAFGTKTSKKFCADGAIS